MTMKPATTGCPARGCSRPTPVPSGLPATGVGATAATYWHPGYWGRHVGFYGGVNYGFGYFGRGYEGGYWDHDRFAYNRSVTNVNIVNVHNVYNKTVINNYNTTRVSFNGGHGGVQMRPTQQEQNWGREQHTAPLPAQHQNETRASQNRLQFANVNHGRPQNLARTEPASYNRNMLTTNRPSNTMAPTTHPVNNVAPGNIHSPAVNNARPMPTNQNVNRAPVNNNNVAHPQTNPQMNQHTQPQPNRPQPSYASQPAHAAPADKDGTAAADATGAATDEAAAAADAYRTSAGEVAAAADALGAPADEAGTAANACTASADAVGSPAAPPAGFPRWRWRA